jgi:hypothetical protein
VKKTLHPALALVVLLVVACLCPAQQGPKPLVTVAFSGYDEILNDIKFIGTLAGDDRLGDMVEAQVDQSPVGLAKEGLDLARPWGFVVQTKGENFPMFGFVPVTDLSKVLEALKPAIGEPSDAGDGVLEINADGQSVFVKEADGWLFIGQSANVLQDTPADPIQSLGGLHELYDLAVRANVANVPPPLRMMAMMPIQAWLQGGVRLPPAMVKQAIEEIQTLLDELDTVEIGLAIDQSTSTACLEYVMTALEGTKTAEQMAQNTGGTSGFAGFALPGAAVTLNVVSKISQAEIDQAKTSMAPNRACALAELENQGLSGADLQQAQKMVNDLFGAIDSLLEGGRVDMGLSLTLKPDALTFVTGFHAGDTAKLDGLIRDFAAQVAREEPAAAEAFQVDADEHEGVKLHVISLPTAGMAARAPKLPDLVGDTLDVVIGIGAQEAYLAAGRDAVATLKKAIDESKAQAAKELPPTQLAVMATPIAEFVAAVAADPQVQGTATMIAEAVAQSGGKDRLTVTTTQIPNGVRVRIELEEGLLKLLGSIPTKVGSGPGGPGF